MNVNGKGAIGNLERYSFLVKQAWEAPKPEMLLKWRVYYSNLGIFLPLAS